MVHGLTPKPFTTETPLPSDVKIKFKVNILYNLYFLIIENIFAIKR